MVTIVHIINVDRLDRSHRPWVFERWYKPILLFGRKLVHYGYDAIHVYDDSGSGFLDGPQETDWEERQLFRVTHIT